MDQTAKLWDLETGKEIATLKVTFNYPRDTPVK
jgi:hypothetical protein